MFDPYRTWLGILPAYQPPSHYRLLGVSLGENDPKVIDAAARRRIAHLRQFQEGVNAHAATKLMNEVARARLVLLDPKKRKAYDASLGLAAMGTGDELDMDALGDADQRMLALAPKKGSRELPLPLKEVAPVVRTRKRGEVAAAPEGGGLEQVPWPVWAMAAGFLFLLGGVVAVVLSGGFGSSSSVAAGPKGSGDPEKPGILPNVPAVQGTPGTDPNATGENNDGKGSQTPTPAPAEPKTAALIVKETHRLTGHRDQVTCVVLSADGNLALSGSADKSIRRWDVKLGQAISPTFTIHDGPVRGLAVDGAGKLAVSCSGDRVGMRLWGPANGMPPPGPGKGIFNGTTADANCLAMSLKGDRLLSGHGDGRLRIWDVNFGKQLAELPGHSEPILAVAVSMDGHQALSAGGKPGGRDFVVRYWDATRGTGRPTREFKGHTAPVVGVAFSADGNRALSASHDGTVRVWDIGSADELRSFTGHQGPVLCVAGCPDGKRAVSGGRDGLVRLWEIESGKEVAHFKGHDDAVRCLCVSADGRWLLTGSADRTLRLWVIPPPAGAPQMPGPLLPQGPFGPMPPAPGGPPTGGSLVPPSPPTQPKGPPVAPPGFQMPKQPPKNR
jgi:hypothetical protein